MPDSTSGPGRHNLLALASSLLGGPESYDYLAQAITAANFIGDAYDDIIIRVPADGNYLGAVLMSCCWRPNEQRRLGGLLH